MTDKTRAFSLVVLVAVIGLAILADPALAADAKSAGKNIGEVVREFATPVMITVAGAIGIAALVKRDVGMAMTLLILVIVLSGFLMKDSPIGDVADGIWKKIGSK